MRVYDDLLWDRLADDYERTERTGSLIIESTYDDLATGPSYPCRPHPFYNQSITDTHHSNEKRHNLVHDALWAARDGLLTINVLPQ